MESNKRELPTIEIKGTVFLVDVENSRFWEKGNQRNNFPFYDLEYKGTYYDLPYNESIKNPLFANPYKCTVRIPQLIEIDPEGMAKKYNLSVQDLEGKTDFDVIVDQDMFIERVFLGKLPVIDIAGDRFLVDMRFDELRYTKDISKRIILRNEDRVELRGNYFFYYDKSAKLAVAFDSSVTLLPENVVKVVLPEDHVLDPLVHSQITDVFRPHVGVNEVKDYLMKCPFHKDMKAEVTPLGETELANKIESKKEAKDAGKQEPLLKKVRESKFDKGRHL